MFLIPWLPLPFVDGRVYLERRSPSPRGDASVAELFSFPFSLCADGENC